MPRPLTIADLIATGRRITGQCTSCGREREVDPASLGLPSLTPVIEVGYRMRCKDCGEKRVLTMPQEERSARRQMESR